MCCCSPDRLRPAVAASTDVRRHGAGRRCPQLVGDAQRGLLDDEQPGGGPPRPVRGAGGEPDRVTVPQHLVGGALDPGPVHGHARAAGPGRGPAAGRGGRTRWPARSARWGRAGARRAGRSGGAAGGRARPRTPATTWSGWCPASRAVAAHRSRSVSSGSAAVLAGPGGQARGLRRVRPGPSRRAAAPGGSAAAGWRTWRSGRRGCRRPRRCPSPGWSRRPRGGRSIRRAAPRGRGRTRSGRGGSTALESTADHFPSAPLSRFGTTRWVCSWGSPGAGGAVLERRHDPPVGVDPCRRAARRPGARAARAPPTDSR